MAKFYSLQIVQKIFTTEDCVELVFDVPSTLAEEFQFEAGQYLTLRAEIDGRDVRRSYSICASPYENKWAVGVKAIPEGVFSNFVKSTVAVGDYIEVAAPTGEFVLKNSSYDNKLFVCFAAGSGITPIISQIREILSQSSNSRCLLFFGNKNSKSIIFKRELEALKNEYMGRFSQYHILSKEKLSGDLFNGRIDASKCEEFAQRFFDPSEVDHFMLCGPFGMTQAVKDFLISTGVEGDRILTELFVAPGAEMAESTTKEDTFDPNLSSQVKVIIDGDSFDFPLDFGGDNILDAAIAHGADLPFACKGGVCSTCKAKIVEGEVSMDVNYALEPDELAKSYILTCQAHPRSSAITIDFDQKS